MDHSKIKSALVKIKPGLQKYLEIMDKLNTVNVSQDETFQRAFNGFYRIRQRSSEFYKEYYTYLEVCKKCPPQFEEVIEYLYKHLGRVEASFSSKLVATLNPDLPIWDVYVLKNLVLVPPAYSCNNRLKKIVELYFKIIDWYNNFMESEDGKIIIEMFDEYYPRVNITKTKKIDFVLWQMRD